MVDDSCLEQTLTESGRRRVHTVDELQANKAQLEMQMVVTYVVAAMVVASEASSRVKTMCGSRIGGWSLPSVMSD
jgi:hypothetical protein